MMYYNRPMSETEPLIQPGKINFYPDSSCPMHYEFNGQFLTRVQEATDERTGVKMVSKLDLQKGNRIPRNYNYSLYFFCDEGETLCTIGVGAIDSAQYAAAQVSLIHGDNSATHVLNISLDPDVNVLSVLGIGSTNLDAVMKNCLAKRGQPVAFQLGPTDQNASSCVVGGYIDPEQDIMQLATSVVYEEDGESVTKIIKLFFPLPSVETAQHVDELSISKKSPAQILRELLELGFKTKVEDVRR